jgi:DNA-binding transcriptional LysR family regulator
VGRINIDAYRTASKLGTISKAAENLHVSHSAISQAIANFIFNRLRSGSSCADEGKTVVKLAHEMINKLMELKELGQKSAKLKWSKHERNSRVAGT